MDKPLNRRVGFHMSISAGLVKALENSRALGCDAVQIFSRNPRSWKKKVFDKKEVDLFKKKKKELDIFPLVIHSIYLINACSDKKDIYKKSKRLLAEEAKNTELLEGEYLVLHPGSCQNKRAGIKKLAKAIDRAGEYLSGNKMILIENVAGGGNQVGKNFRELEMILNAVKKPEKVGVCLDTCHLFAYGYNLRIKMDVMSMFSEIVDTISLEKIKLIHLNDSKFELGTKRDQHSHLGKGYISTRGFTNLFEVGLIDHVPLIMETPKDSEDADKRNLNKLKRILNRV